MSSASRLAANPFLLAYICPEGAASYILFIRRRRERVRTQRGMPSPWIPTPYLMSLVANALHAVSSDNQAEYFGMLRSDPSTHPAAEWLYEGWVHSRFSSDKAIPCSWKHSRDPPLPPALKPAPVVYCTSLSNVPTDKSFYWRPSKTNLPGVDGVLFDREDQVIYAIQATIWAKYTGVVGGLQEIQSALPTELRSLPLRVILATWNKWKLDDLMREAQSDPGWPDEVAIGGCAIPTSLGKEYKLVRMADFLHLICNTDTIAC